MVNSTPCDTLRGGDFNRLRNHRHRPDAQEGSGRCDVRTKEGQAVISDNIAGVLLTLCIILILIGSAVSTSSNSKRIAALHVEAVTRGYAEWRVDPQTGSTTFTWIEPAKAERNKK